MPFVQKGGFDRKLEFVKQQSSYRQDKGESHGLVFVIDSEGGHKKAYRAVADGRDRRYLDLPTAIGVAHPCIEAWLLADPSAIRAGLKLMGDPHVPEDPESLPAPCDDRTNNPKTHLAQCAGQTGELTVAQKTAIARCIRDPSPLIVKCRIGFAPFADEVVTHIKPLFAATGPAA